MKALNYRPVANGDGKFAAWLHTIRNRSGAYVIRRVGDHAILYVGESHTGSLAKTIKRHFYAWRDDPERPHHTYGRSVEVAVRLTPPTTARRAQNNLIRRLSPRDNGTNPNNEPF